MPEPLPDLEERVRRELAALAGQIGTLRTLFLEERAAQSRAIDALSERIDGLEERVQTVHKQALRVATHAIKPRGAA